jgi:mono/diheme cytochrome c family protein
MRVLLLAALPLAIPASGWAQSPGSNLARAGDPVQGAALVRDWCISCHVVGTGPTARGTDAVPSFPAIARDPAKGPDYVARFLANPHPAMPPMPLSRMAVNDIVAYFRALQQSP